MVTIVYEGGVPFHEPTTLPSVRWVTYRRYHELEEHLVRKNRQLSTLEEDITELEAELASLQQECAIGVNVIRDMEIENQRLRDAIQNWLDGNYPNPSTCRPNPCPHGKLRWQGCNECEEAYWESVLNTTEVNDEQI